MLPAADRYRIRIRALSAWLPTSHARTGIRRANRHSSRRPRGHRRSGALDDATHLRSSFPVSTVPRRGLSGLSGVSASLCRQPTRVRPDAPGTMSHIHPWHRPARGEPECCFSPHWRPRRGRRPRPPAGRLGRRSGGFPWPWLAGRRPCRGAAGHGGAARPPCNRTLSHLPSQDGALAKSSCSLSTSIIRVATLVCVSPTWTSVARLMPWTASARGSHSIHSGAGLIRWLSAQPSSNTHATSTG